MSLFSIFKKKVTSMTGSEGEPNVQEVENESEGQVQEEEIPKREDEIPFVGEPSILNEEQVAPSEQSVLIRKTPEGHPYDEYPGCRSNTVIKLVDRSMFPGQMYSYLVDCSCGFQARVFTKNEGFAVGERHLGRRMNEV
jgi:hypothetical protein